MADDIFCKIARHEMEARYAYEDDLVVAIEDIKPGAPVHLLVIPKRHFDNARGVDDAQVLARMFEVGHRLAEEKGVAESGYRLVFNVGRDAGQSVDHVHLHLLGGRRLAWPPG